MVYSAELSSMALFSTIQNVCEAIPILIQSNLYSGINAGDTGFREIHERFETNRDTPVIPDDKRFAEFCAVFGVKTGAGVKIRESIRNRIGIDVASEVSFGRSNLHIQIKIFGLKGFKFHMGAGRYDDAACHDGNLRQALFQCQSTMFDAGAVPDITVYCKRFALEGTKIHFKYHLSMTALKKLDSIAVVGNFHYFRAEHNLKTQYQA